MGDSLHKRNSQEREEKDMSRILEIADQVSDVGVSLHGERASYFEPTAARCSSSSTCTCCCT